MRIPVRVKVLNSSLPLIVEYKCEHCGKVERYVHYLQASTPVAQGRAEEKNRKIIEDQLKLLSDSKNPEMYSKACLSHVCEHCAKSPRWAKFKKNNMESLGTSFVAGMFVSFVLGIILSSTALKDMGDGILAIVLLPLIAIPLVRYFLVKRKNEKLLEELKDISPECLPTFRVRQ